ncbi:DNA-binding transcriptional regulator, LysR family [Sinosporangium album]|uniref:DNA-binding transcriptional regulator, LysR family n=1 Tax=Sinosporangium album TaxID=504805 RepID=A0A1G8IYL0_9ACTN|nr:LysR family transcriptional regulator [Sinosporangium album]SDI24145.1 DNA-binding transcriptional regulator, LysR family [Sinosporangium album]
MELRQVEHFVAVAQELNFSRAAERLHLGQSAVSSSIRALERDLNTVLFIRDSRTVQLTHAGQVFLPVARRLLATAREALDNVSAVSGLLTGTIRIGIIQTLERIDIPGALADLRKRHPGLSVHLRDEQPHTMLTDVARGRLDLAVVPAIGDEPPGVQLQPLHREDFVLITSTTHRLADRVTVDLDELTDEVWVEFLKGSTLRQVNDEVLGTSRTVVADLGQMALLVSLVQADVGIAIVPRCVAENAGMPTIGIRQAFPPREILLAYPAGPISASTSAVIDAFLSAKRRRGTRTRTPMNPDPGNPGPDT